MAEPETHEGIPGTPAIREVRPENLTDGIIRTLNFRAEIDTSPPFASVKEAVTRFGGSGPWLPLNDIEDFDIKKVEEQATELEKDLIVKELETLDVLEELGATKRIVEELKQRLQKEALKCFDTPQVHSYEPIGSPVIKDFNKENYGDTVDNQEQILLSSSPCSASPPDRILMELKQAKVNLGKTISDLGVIQSSVESLNKKMKKEKIFLGRTHEKLVSKFADDVSVQERPHEQTRVDPPPAPVETSYNFGDPMNDIMRSFNSQVSNPLSVYEDNGFGIKIAEMRWFAAKKMEEAAIAAEAIALAEINALSNIEKVSIPEAQIPQESTTKKVIDSKYQIDGMSISKLAVLRRMEEATEEVRHSKQVLKEALNRVETANRKQHAAEEALRRWIPENDVKGEAVYNKNDAKPALRPTVSMRDVLSRKQIPEEYETKKDMEEHSSERQKVALSQMLRALREDLTLPPAKAENDEKDGNGSDQKQFIAQRKKFGFIHISLPLAKPSKKRA